jgi:hypothetical protein
MTNIPAASLQSSIDFLTVFCEPSSRFSCLSVLTNKKEEERESLSTFEKKVLSMKKSQKQGEGSNEI